MSRSRDEIRAHLNSVVGQSISAADGALCGQCVSLIKDLMWFVGVPDPRAGRGNAAQAGDAYISQGIGKAGRGWLTVCVNRTMAYPYGHIWIDVSGEFNIEQNGAVPLHVTKNTRPLSQAQQFVNFDQWVSGSAAVPAPAPKPEAAQEDDMLVAQVVAGGQLYTSWVGANGDVLLVTNPVDQSAGGLKAGGRFLIGTNSGYVGQAPALQVFDNGAFVTVSCRHKDGYVVLHESGKWPWDKWSWRRLT